ncbi:hypothetical protein CEXT_779421 [Caerostris extrusa]|uniref:Peptidase M12A domain-containing protein n=1 Tax=Caerostris extrusa TaxID=172846 RepID=A0AAV4VJI5_CAEEX|nr:hypothetical protein CEXT_779421 [Caerostris extrusa]
MHIRNSPSKGVKGGQCLLRRVLKSNCPTYLIKRKRRKTIPGSPVLGVIAIADAKVPYIIDASLKDHMDVITQAFNNYHSTTCVRFVPRTNQPDYIKLFAGQG